MMYKKGGWNRWEIGLWETYDYSRLKGSQWYYNTVMIVGEKVDYGWCILIMLIVYVHITILKEEGWLRLQNVAIMMG